jgi:hypothetical protein
MEDTFKDHFARFAKIREIGQKHFQEFCNYLESLEKDAYISVIEKNNFEIRYYLLGAELVSVLESEEQPRFLQGRISTYLIIKNGLDDERHSVFADISFDTLGNIKVMFGRHAPYPENAIDNIAFSLLSRCSSLNYPIPLR